jgi:tryptophan 2,3-dioxygenase
MKEGVGMFPETQHQYTLYNRGEKKGEKPITTKQAISMMEHERWLDEQEQLAAEEEYEYIMTSIYVDEMKESVCWLNNQLEYSNARLRQMMESIKELNDSINSMRQEKERLIERIMKEEDWLEAHKK